MPKFKDPKTELRLVEIDQIKPWAKNPRLNDEVVPAVEKSIRMHGYLDFIETDERLNILAGHTRLKALVSISQNGGIAGIKNVIGGKIPVLVHSGLKHKDAYRLANNKTGEYADWDLPVLKDILEDLDTGEFDMDGTGFSSESIEELMTQFHTPAEGLTDEDDIPEAEEAITKTGDLWLLGEHRLLCGDSTKAEDMERLMDGQKADMTFTDPPYGVDYTGKTKEKLKIANDKDNTAFPNVMKVLALKAGGAIYVCCPAGNNFMDFEEAFRQRCYQSSTIIWVKNTLVLGHGDYHYQHEPILGSGTTLIACEKLGRRCYGMEIEPHYCDVIVKRWENYTGKKAVLADAAKA